MTMFLTNDKLGPGVKGFSLPPGKTCPGASATCKRVCYVSRYTKRFHIDYSSHLRLVKDFKYMSLLLANESAKVIRLHVAGDFFSAGYVRHWIKLVKAFPGKIFYGYTKSWRVPRMRAALQALAREPNVKLWLSCDRDTGTPTGPVKPFAGRAWLAVDDHDLPTGRCELVFRNIRHSFMHHMGTVLVCPHENGLLEAVKHVKCANCKRCFR